MSVDLVQRLRKRAVDFRSDRLRELVTEAAAEIENQTAKARRLDREASRLEAELEHSRAVLRTTCATANDRLATINRLSLRERDLVAELEALKSERRQAAE